MLLLLNRTEPWLISFALHFMESKSLTQAHRKIWRDAPPRTPHHQIISHPGSHTTTVSHWPIRCVCFSFFFENVCAFIWCVPLTMCHDALSSFTIPSASLSLSLSLSLSFTLLLLSLAVCSSVWYMHRLSKSIHSDNFAPHFFLSFISFICSCRCNCCCCCCRCRHW